MNASVQTGRRVALASMVGSAGLALAKIIIGSLAHSTAVVADGIESASDVLATGAVLFGILLGSKPADENHPYGHGRFETLTGLGLGALLSATGLTICVRSLMAVGKSHPTTALFAIWPVLASVVLKSFMAGFKFRYGRRIHSQALVADAWNDSVDILSGLTAAGAVLLTLYDPSRFRAADHYGGFVIGLIVVFLGLRVVRETSLQLMDTMPDAETMQQIRAAALTVSGALGVEKCFARRSGMQFYVDLHLEVDPRLTVAASHDIATQVREKIRERLEWVADVLVHVEPHLGDGAGQDVRPGILQSK